MTTEPVWRALRSAVKDVLVVLKLSWKKTVGQGGAIVTRTLSNAGPEAPRVVLLKVSVVVMSEAVNSKHSSTHVSIGKVSPVTSKLYGIGVPPVTDTSIVTLLSTLVKAVFPAMRNCTRYRVPATVSKVWLIAT